MSTLELKQELHRFIETGDATFVKMFYDLAKTYHKEQSRLDKMIEEGEEDIEAGNILSSDEIKNFIANWEK